MIKDIRYKFDNFEIIENNNEYILKEHAEYDFEQRKLFTIMLNFGYINFEHGIFNITAKEIIEFWNYSKNSVLKNYSLEKYYSLLNLNKLYIERIPSLKTEGSFFSNDFKMTVVWIKNDSKIYSAPIAYKQQGLRLKELEFNETIGSLFPEYFILYYKIDNANTNWENWNVKQRYDFLEDIYNLSKEREIVLPTNLSELLNKHKNEMQSKEL